MKVAICLSGDMRGASWCLESLKENVINPFKSAHAKVDLLIHTRLDPWWIPAITLPFRMLRVEENVSHIDPSPIINCLNPTSRGQFESEFSHRRGFLYQAFLQYYRSLQGVAELKRRAEEQDRGRYDIVVRARPDIGYVNPINVSAIRPNTVYFPENERWPGKDPSGNVLESLSDQFAIGPSREMDIYFDRMSVLQEFCQSYYLHAETFMAWHMNRFGIHWEIMEGLRTVRWIDDTSKLYVCSWRPDRKGQ